MSAASNLPSSPTKALRQNSAATRKFSTQDARAELRSTMREKTTIIPLEKIMEDFLTPVSKSAKAIPNVFTKVPKFSSEREMYDYIVSGILRSISCSVNSPVSQCRPRPSTRPDSSLALA